MSLQTSPLAKSGQLALGLNLVQFTIYFDVAVSFPRIIGNGAALRSSCSTLVEFIYDTPKLILLSLL